MNKNNNMKIETNISNAEYHASSGLSASTITSFGLAGSPHKWRQERRGLSQEMHYGTLVHHWAVDRLDGLPEGFSVKPAVLEGEPWQGNRKACRQWVDERKDDFILSNDEIERCKITVEALMNHQDARKLLLTEADREISVYSRFDNFDEVEVKCRPDLLFDGRSQIADLKTTRDATPGAFSKQAANLGYHVKAAWYMDVCEAAGMDISTFWWIAVEIPATVDERPEVGVYYAYSDSPQIERGRDLYRQWLRQFMDCQKSDTWPMACQSPLELQLPAWAFKG